MKHEELQAIKDRYEKAASGPWEFKDDNEGTEYRPFWVVSENNADSGEWLAEIHVGSELDAEFIAHARQDVPSLIAEVERLREALEKVTCDEYSYLEIAKIAHQALGGE